MELSSTWIKTNDRTSRIPMDLGVVELDISPDKQVRIYEDPRKKRSLGPLNSKS